jgi:Fe-S oxidoreductase
MKVLYPQVTGESFEVRTWFELATFRNQNVSVRVTLHDPCFYGRYLCLSDIPYRILEKLGIDCVRQKNSGGFTNCCGGPAESVSPKLTNEVLGRRVEELNSAGAPVLAMCPICLGNLLRAGVPAEDFSTFVARYV